MFNEHEISLLRVTVRVETMLQNARSGGQTPDMDEFYLLMTYARGKIRLARKKNIQIAVHPLLISAVVEFVLGVDPGPDISAIAVDDPRIAGAFTHCARLPPDSSPSDVLDAALAALRAGTQSAEPAGAQSAEVSLTPNNIAPSTVSGERVFTNDIETEILHILADIAAFETALVKELKARTSRPLTATPAHGGAHPARRLASGRTSEEPMDTSESEEPTDTSEYEEPLEMAEQPSPRHLSVALSEELMATAHGTSEHPSVRESPLARGSSDEGFSRDTESESESQSTRAGEMKLDNSPGRGPGRPKKVPNITPLTLAPRTPSGEMILTNDIKAEIRYMRADFAAAKRAFNDAKAGIKCAQELQMRLENFSMFHKRQQLLHADALTRVKELEEEIAILQQKLEASSFDTADSDTDRVKKRPQVHAVQDKVAISAKAAGNKKVIPVDTDRVKKRPRVDAVQGKVVISAKAAGKKKAV